VAIVSVAGAVRLNRARQPTHTPVRSTAVFNFFDFRSSGVAPVIERVRTNGLGGGKPPADCPGTDPGVGGATSRTSGDTYGGRSSQ